MSNKKTGVVIAGSASLQNEISKWKDFWNNRKNHIVIDFPLTIEKKKSS